MRILLAPDSFKESASAEAIAQAMVRGIKRGNPQAECRLMPLSDGGEGSIDSQTPYGKVPSGIAKLAQSQGKPTIAIGGTVTRDPHTIEALNETGIVATFGIAPGPADLATLIADTERNVEITCAAIAGTLRVASATAVTAATSPCEST